jgi:hypothetical protein
VCDEAKLAHLGDELETLRAELRERRLEGSPFLRYTTPARQAPTAHRFLAAVDLESRRREFVGYEP